MLVLAKPLLFSSFSGASIVRSEGLLLGIWIYGFRAILTNWLLCRCELSSSLVVLWFWHITPAFLTPVLGWGRSSIPIASNLNWLLCLHFISGRRLAGEALVSLDLSQQSTLSTLPEIVGVVFKPRALICFLLLLSLCSFLSFFMVLFSYIFMSVNPWFCSIKNLLGPVICPWVVNQFT